MINISSLDIKNFEYIKAGTFGTIYKVNDHVAYKIYHDMVKDSISGTIYNNPCLYVRKSKLKSLIERSKNLEYSDGIFDLVYVDNRFHGIATTYNEGDDLFLLEHASFDKKVPVSREIIRNAKELYNHFIYPDDISHSNIMYVNGKIKLVDVDDVRTHVCYHPNMFFRALSVKTIANTLEVLLGDYSRYNTKREVKKELEKVFIRNPYSISSINNYIDSLEEEKDFIFIDESTDMSRLKEFKSNHDFKLVYVTNDRSMKTDKLLDIIFPYQEKNMGIYDIVYKDDLDGYDQIDNINEAYVLEENNLKKIYSKRI